MSNGHLHFYINGTTGLRDGTEIENNLISFDNVNESGFDLKPIYVRADPGFKISNLKIMYADTNPIIGVFRYESVANLTFEEVVAKFAENKSYPFEGNIYFSNLILGYESSSGVLIFPNAITDVNQMILFAVRYLNKCPSSSVAFKVGFTEESI